MIKSCNHWKRVFYQKIIASNVPGKLKAIAVVERLHLHVRSFGLGTSKKELTEHKTENGIIIGL